MGYCFVLVSPEFALASPKQSDRKGNNKDSKCKLKKYLFGNKTKESSAHFTPQWLLPIAL